MNEHNLNEDVQERREAEVEYVTSAYSPTEAWVERISNEKRNNNSSSSPVITIHRNLDLPSTNEVFELILTMTKEYLAQDDSKLLINATLADNKNNTSNPKCRRKALNAIPNLLSVCREEALSLSGQESVFAILQKADEWIETEWETILLNNTEEKENHLKSDNSSSDVDTLEKSFVLERRLIYSHHIIASSKRRALSHLSKYYNLGGYAKIGWPGIIIIEGNTKDCEHFWDEIRIMRWQYLVIRGSQTLSFSSLDEMKSNFVFERSIVELGENDMSILAKKCRDVGLHELFMTAFKKHKNSTTESNDDHSNEPESQSFSHGALALLDHINNTQVYHTFLRNVTKEANCTFVRLDYKNPTTQIQRSRIIILIIGLTDIGVKQVLKQWRISKVDVDKKGKPCKERMMTVLIEGSLMQSSSFDDVLDLEELEECYDDTLTIENIISNIGGKQWLEAIRI